MNSYQYCNLVRITVEAYSACLSHALVTDSEEVMGLLLGNIKHDPEIGQIINIISTICLTRKCKAKDRVEFDEIQIAKASEIADSLASEHNIEVNVVGWYHSHPKITIPPSSVDLATQFAQQYQGPFVGLIISCFHNDSSNTNKINLIAFQTKNENGINAPLFIDIDFIYENDLISNLQANVCNSAQTFSNILKNLLSEEDEQFKKDSSNIEKDDYLNNLIISGCRQSLLAKVIQNVSTPHSMAISSEIENLKNYIAHMKDANSKLKNLINSYQMINKYKDYDN
jgi:BRCA1/BRCA2-containing complex subunit 3